MLRWFDHYGLPTEREGRAGFAIAVLNDIIAGAFAELEDAIGIAIAVLLKRAVVAVAFLMNNTEIAAAELRQASHVVGAVLLDRSALNRVDDAIDGQTGLDRLLFLGQELNFVDPR